VTLRVIIADDEPLAREQLLHLLSAEPDVKVISECRNGPETVAAVRRLKPDLLLLDVQMPDLDGFGVLVELHPDEIPPVVFVTAYDQYALKAFEVRALDYLLKPVDPRRLKEALRRIGSREARSSAQLTEDRIEDLLREVSERRRAYHRLAVPVGEKILFLQTESIYSLEASGNYVQIHATGGKYLRRQTLASLAERLDPDRFVRVHRSWIVNVDRIKELVPWFRRTYFIVLENGQRIHVSHSFRESVEALLGPRPKPASS
jgi:two-component system LytT family response regulator